MKAWRRHNAKKEAREHALANSALNNGDVKKWHAHEVKAHRAGKHAMGRHGKGAVNIPMGPPPLADGGVPPPIPLADQENIPPVVIPDGPPVVVPPNASNVSGLPPSPPSNSEPIVIPPGGGPTGPIVVPPSGSNVSGFPPSYTNRGGNYGGSSSSLGPPDPIPVLGEGGFGGPSGDNKDSHGSRGYGDHSDNKYGGSSSYRKSDSYRGLSYPVYGTPYVIPVSGSFGGPPAGAIPVVGSDLSDHDKYGDSGPSSSGHYDFGGPPPGGIPVLGGDNKSEGGDSSVRDSEDRFKDKSDDWKKNLPPGFDIDGVTILPSVIVNGSTPDMVITPPPGTYPIAAPPAAVPVAAPAAPPVVPVPAAPVVAAPAAVEVTASAAVPPPPVVVTPPPLPTSLSGSSIMLPPVAGAPGPTIMPPPVVAPSIMPPSPLGSVVMPFDPFPFVEEVGMRPFPNGMHFPPEPIVVQEFGGTMEAAVEATYWSDPVMIAPGEIIEERAFLPPVPPSVQPPIVEASGGITLPPMHAGASREVAPPLCAPPLAPVDVPPMPGAVAQLPPRQMSPMPPPQSTFTSRDHTVIPPLPIPGIEVERSSPMPMNHWNGSTVSSHTPDTARTFMPITPRQESSRTHSSTNGPVVGPPGSTPFPTHQGHRGNEMEAAPGFGGLAGGMSFENATKLPPRYVDGGNRGTWTGGNDTGLIQMQPIPIQSQPSFSGRGGSPADIEIRSSPMGGLPSPKGSETVSSIGGTLTREDLNLRDTWSSNGYMGVPQVPLRGVTPLPPQPDTFSKNSVSAAYPSTYRFDNERMSDSGSVRSVRSSGSMSAFPNAH